MITRPNNLRPQRFLVSLARQVFGAPLVLLLIAETAAAVGVPLALAVLVGSPHWRFTPAAAAAFGLLCAGAATAMGLYSRRQRARFSGVVVRLATVAMIAMAGTAVLSFMFVGFGVGRLPLLASGAAVLVVLAVIRFAFDRTAAEELLKRRVLVYGAGKRASSVTRLRRRSDTRGFRVVGFVLTEGDRGVTDAAPLVDPPVDLLTYCRSLEVDEIVVAMDDRRRAFPVHELLECRLAGIAVTELIDFLESETGRVRLDVLNPSWMIFSPGFSRSPVRQLTRRVLDVVASILLLALLWPLGLMVAIAIKAEDGWRAPVLYRQKRVGFQGATFELLKFRSMRVDAEDGGSVVWARRCDPRVTCVGAFLRRSRLDEFPQLLNVLRGEMSFVGPRPERPEFVRELELVVPYYRERHAVKPGITGWAQLCYAYGDSVDAAAEKLQYDLYYVKNNSLLFDLIILLQTVEVVLWGKGAR